MFSSLSKILSSKFGRNDDLSRQVEIAKVLDLCRGEIKKLFPEEEITVVSLKNKTVLILVSSPALASELRLRESSIITAVNTALHKQVIKRIVYRF